MRELGWYDQYLDRGRVDRAANTTPGNKAGGLSNITEKAMGSVIKSGSAAIASVLPPGEKLKADQTGLVFAATPASDFICGTLQLAAGMNLHVFTTGRGTPYGLAAVPVVKVATRSDLARRWHDLMDVNAGRIADGEQTIEQAGLELGNEREDAVDRVAQPQADVGGDLVVAAAAGVQAFAGVAHQLRQARLDVQVHVFQRQLPFKRAALDFGADGAHPALDGGVIELGNDALGGQHFGVRQAALDVGRGQPLVEEHAGGVALHQLAHGFAEQGGPGFGFLVELVG